MPRKKRKTRVTKAEIRKIQEERKKSVKGRKNKIIPGPWTEIDPGFKVKAHLRWGKNYIGKPVLGSYRQEDMWLEKSWYPISLNITSRDIKAKVKKHGLEKYVAACEKSLNSTKKNIKKQGHMVILEVISDNSQKEDPEARFISCRGKTNKKSVIGFSAFRVKNGKRSYIILEDESAKGDS